MAVRARVGHGLLLEYIESWTRRLLAVPYLRAVRETFYLMMPLLVLLALLDMAGNVIINPLGPVMSSEGLGLGTFLSGGLYGDDYRDSAFFRNMEALASYFSITVPLLSLLFSLTLSDRLARLWSADRLYALLSVSAGYIFILQGFQGNLQQLSLYFQGRGFFLALVLATCTVLCLSLLSKPRFLRLPLPEGLPGGLAKSCRLALPLSITISLSLAVSYAWLGFDASSASLPLLLREELGVEFGQLPLVAMGTELCRRLLWWLGLDGFGLMGLVTEAFYVPAQLANEYDGGSFIFTIEFFDSLSISLLGLAISIWVFSTRQRMRQISAFSLPCLIMSINEPFLFALPIVLNPLFLIPYLLAPMMNMLVGWIAIEWGLVPVFQYALTATVPVLLQGGLATGSVMGAVLQLVWLSLDVVIYSPFVIIFNLLEAEDGLEREEAAI